MHVCAYVCVYVSIVYVYVCMCLCCMHVHMHNVCMHVYRYVKHLCICLCMYVCIHVWGHLIWSICKHQTKTLSLNLMLNVTARLYGTRTMHRKQGTKRVSLWSTHAHMWNQPRTGWWPMRWIFRLKPAWHATTLSTSNIITKKCYGAIIMLISLSAMISQ